MFDVHSPYFCWLKRFLNEIFAFKLAAKADQKPKSSAREDTTSAKKPTAAEKSASNLDDSLTRKKPGIESMFLPF